jgi:hypothetical protein
MSIILQSSGGGSVTIQEPTTASTLTATLPAATGTVMVSGNMPAFSAYQSSAQTLSSNTLTKIQFQSEEFDTASAFDSTTNYRFTPQVAGYYQINFALAVGVAATNILLNLYKNGSAFKVGFSSSASMASATMSALVFLNGSTDYIEAYAQITVGQVLATTATYTYFQGSLVRTS